MSSMHAYQPPTRGYTTISVTIETHSANPTTVVPMFQPEIHSVPMERTVHRTAGMHLPIIGYVPRTRPSQSFRLSSHRENIQSAPMQRTGALRPAPRIALPEMVQSVPMERTHIAPTAHTTPHTRAHASRRRGATPRTPASVPMVRSPGWVPESTISDNVPLSDPPHYFEDTIDCYLVPGPCLTNVPVSPAPILSSFDSSFSNPSLTLSGSNDSSSW